MNVLNKAIGRIILYLRIIKFRYKIFKIKQKKKGLFNRIDKFIERKHVLLWGQLFPNVNLYWLRYYTNLSGISDHKYVPEDIYYAVVERRLNDSNYSNFLSDKNFFDINYDPLIFPKVIIKNISKEFYNNNSSLINFSQADSILNAYKNDFIVKPSLDSGGGKNVLLIRYENGHYRFPSKEKVTLNKLHKIYKSNYIIQEYLIQHNFLSQFNQSSVNTLRMFTYRSTKTNEIHLLKTVIRMGRKNTCVDNIKSSNGVSCFVDINGKLNEFAYSLYGEKHFFHPDTNIYFKGMIVPHFKKIKNTLCNLAKNIPAHRLLSFDVIIDVHGSMKLVEINTVGMEINFLQMYGGSLFGNFTEEIVDYCKTHSDDFICLRTTK